MIDHDPVFMGRHKLKVGPACDSNLVNWNGFSQSPLKYLSKLVFGLLSFGVIIIFGCLTVLYFRNLKQETESVYPEFATQNLNPSF